MSWYAIQCASKLGYDILNNEHLEYVTVSFEKGPTCVIPKRVQHVSFQKGFNIHNGWAYQCQMP